MEISVVIEMIDLYREMNRTWRLLVIRGSLGSTRGVGKSYLNACMQNMVTMLDRQDQPYRMGVQCS